MDDQPSRLGDHGRYPPLERVMPNLESEAWERLVDAIARSIPNIRSRLVPPVDTKTVSSSTDSTGRPLPESLLSLYSITNGINLSGYLPDHYSPTNSTFSLLPLREVSEWHSIMLQNHKPRGGLWPLFPHWLKTMTMNDEADGIWHVDWIPFASDGAAGVQFVNNGIRRGVYQYNPETFGIRRCSGTVAGYLNAVTNAIHYGKLNPFDVNPDHGG